MSWFIAYESIVSHRSHLLSPTLHTSLSQIDRVESLQTAHRREALALFHPQLRFYAGLVVTALDRAELWLVKDRCYLLRSTR